MSEDAVHNLLNRMRLLEDRVHALENPPKTIGKGKYSNKTTAWVLENDPNYVIWLHEAANPGTMVSFGFTLDQLKQAYAAHKLRELKPAGEKEPPREAAPLPVRRTPEEYDDDNIPF